MPSSSVLVATMTQSRDSVNARSARRRSSVDSEARDRNVVTPLALTDLLRSLLSTFIDTLMGGRSTRSAAPYGTSSPERVNVGNGYRHRDFDTRAGTLDVAIRKLRAGSYFRDWLLERRRRAEAVLTSVAATSHLLGVSTRRTTKTWWRCLDT
jgi:transposase-like protein